MFPSDVISLSFTPFRHLRLNGIIALLGVNRVKKNNTQHLKLYGTRYPTTLFSALLTGLTLHSRTAINLIAFLLKK